MTFRQLFFALCIATITPGCLFGGPDDDTNNGDPNSSNDTSATNSGENNTANDDNGGDSALARCAGSYVGSFDGDDTGVVAGELDAGGRLTITYNSSTGVVSGSAVTVTESGDISGTGDGSNITGTLDFSTCSMSGQWTSDVGSGTWEAQKRA